MEPTTVGRLLSRLGQGTIASPNLTASEIVTFADHVVVAEVTDDNSLPVPKEDVDRGEGLVLRDLTFHVRETVWSNQSAAHAVPQEFNWTAVGWFFKGSVDNRTVAGYEGTPRFEKGQIYVVALDWDQHMCEEPGEWSPLGGSFNMPYESEVIGVGEFEGELLSESELKETKPSQGIRAEVSGRSLWISRTPSVPPRSIRR